MRVLGVVLLIVAFLLLTLAGVGVQLGVGFQRTVGNPDFYLTAFREQGLYSAPGRLIGRMLEEEGLADEGPMSLVVESIEETLSPEWVEGEMTRLIYHLYDYLRGEEQQLEMVLDLRERKSFLAQLLKDKIMQLEPEAQLALLPEDFLSSLEGRYSSEELSRGLPERLVDDIIAVFLQELALPDEVDMAEFVNLEEPLNQARSLIQSYTSLGLVVPALVVLGLLGACFLLGGLAGGLRWVGASMVLSVVLTLAALYVAGDFVATAALEGAPPDPKFVEILGTEPKDLVGLTWDRIAASVRSVSIPYGGAGLLMLAVSFLFRRPRRAERAAGGR